MHFFISSKYLNGKTIYPRIPNNRLTDTGLEDYVTPRVCMSKSIIGALESTMLYTRYKRVYLYACDFDKIFTPSIQEVPDQWLTGEEWSIGPTKLDLIATLMISSRSIRHEQNDHIVEYTIRSRKYIGLLNPFKLYDFYGR